MSLGPKASSKGASKSSGQSHAKHNNISHKNADKSQNVGKGSSDADDASVYKQKVVQLMEMTRRSEEEVCSALNDCDFDVAKACDLLFEEANTQSQWQTKEKKKKKATPVNSGASVAAVVPSIDIEPDWDESGTSASGPPAKDFAKPAQRSRFQSRPYRGRGGDGYGGTFGEDGDGSAQRGPNGPRRGGSRGTGRGGARGAVRGGRGAPRGSRTSRPPRTVDTWDNSTQEKNEQSNNWFPTPDDWDYEEWSGSLADTKVFTPSSINSADNDTIQAAVVPEEPPVQQSPMLPNINEIAPNTSQPTQAVTITQDPAIYGYTKSHISKDSLPVSGSLSAAQTQYLSQLTQKSEMKDRSLVNAAQTYNSNYGVVYGSNELSTQRKPLQRARVPPPSKIPSSAVEMPGDLGSSSIGLLDVQFGALDFNSDTGNFLSDSITQNSTSISNDKYSNASSGLEHVLNDNTVNSQSSALDSLQTSTTSVLNNELSQYSTNSSNSNQMLVSDSLSSAVSVEQNASSAVSTAINPVQYVSSQTSARTPQSNSSHQVVQLTTVSSLESQLTAAAKAGNTDITGQSVYSAYPSQVPYVKAFQPAQPSYPYSQVNSNTTSLTAASSTTAGNISNSYSQSNSQYQQSQSINTYQNSSVYGNSGLYSTSSIPYGYQTSNKIGSKDSQYDNTVTSSNSLSNTPTTQSSKSGSTTASKSIASSANSGVLSSGTGGHVAPAVMGQYILGQTFFPQQMTTYSFEDLQLLPQRMPHMPGYYDMGYGASTGATGTRDGAIPSFASLGSTDGRFGRTEAPSPSQGGVGAHQGGSQPPTGPPSVQQAQQPATLMGSSQPIQPYAYFTYSQGVMPGSFPPYSTPPMYQLATGNAASSSYGSGKGVGGGAGGYVGGAYGTPQPTNAPQPQYEPNPQPQQSQHNSHQQDYKTGGGYSSSQQSSSVKQGGVMNSTSGSTDLNNSMYGGSKSHVSLNKVNSYDKAAYHSGTPPPPFGLTGNTAGSAGGYATAPQHMYISHTGMPPPPQQHQPQLQIDGRGTNSHSRRDNGTSSSRGTASGQSKQGSGTKAGYSPPYWNPNSNC